MDIFLITFQAVAALLGIGILGFWIIGRRRLPSNALGLLSSLAIDVALPCLVLASIITQFSPQKYPDWWQMPLWWAGSSLVFLALTVITSRLAHKDNRREFAMSLFYQNGIFFPLIIITGIFLNQAAPYITQLFLFIFLQPTLVFSTYSLFFRQKQPARKPSVTIRLFRLLNPMLVMTVIGLIIGLSGTQSYIPNFVVMIVTLMGAIATPLFMLILGGNVYNDFMYKEASNRRIFIAEVVKFILIKNLLFPFVVLGLLLCLRPDYTIAFILILQAAVPPITAVPIFTERLGGNRAITNQFIVASFLFSLVSIPAVIYVFSLFFPFPPLG